MEKYFLFVDKVSGEEFIVMAKTALEAQEIAEEYFEEPHFLDLLSEYEAELSGLDTY